jgi:hypothetical protein
MRYPHGVQQDVLRRESATSWPALSSTVGPHLDGEQEMFEQEESVDLNGEVHIPKEVFALWYASGEAAATQREPAGLSQRRPCAAVVCRYSVDQQGLDFRGSVAADTSWDLCCRLLSLTPQPHTIIQGGLLAQWICWEKQNVTQHQKSR